MGVVLKATHIDLECAVAIKIIRPEHAENEDFVARLLAEARIAASLRSKHVNRVLDVGRTNSGVPYLVLEYMEGSDLASHLESRGPFSASDAVDCVIQACEALAEAHATDIVHRDLKPENLFLSEEADGSLVLKVLDFGISKKGPAKKNGRALTNPWEVVGTPSYMAPEQIRGTDVVDGRADIWALGIILHELCTGQTPFDAEAVPDVFALVLGGLGSSFNMGAHVPAGLQAVVRKCLRKEADDRYQSVVELAAALSAFGSDAQQAGRVAKVATTTSARIAALQSSLGVTGSSASAGTPLALAATKLDSQKAVSRRRRRGFNMKLVGIVAAVPFALGLGYVAAKAAGRAPFLGESLAMQAPLPAAQAAPIPAAEVATLVAPSPAEPTVNVPSAKSSSEGVRKTPPSTRYALGVRMPALVSGGGEVPSSVDTAPVKAPAAGVASVGAATHTASAKPEEPTSDAWNPKSFGGRR